MPTLRDIKRRINAVKNTRQITKAMKMVAAAKLRKAQDRMMQMRPYAEKMDAVIAHLSRVSGEGHPLMTQRPRETVEIMVVTSDRGLCGAFNSNILKTAERIIDEWRRDNFKVSISVVGRKARDYFKRRDIPMRKEWVGLSGGKVAFSDVKEIASDIIDSYINHTIDEVLVVYNRFKSVMSQEVVTAQLLPVITAGTDAEEQEETAVYIYEPSQKVILDMLLPMNVEVQIYRALLESQAAEEAARMTAMENATKNADEMIDNLTLQFNKARQASITKELMDIVGGVEALRQSE